MSEVQETYKYKYNAYISYSSADRPWAEKLSRDLERSGIEAFLDQQRLQPGATWDRQLLEALRLSRHLVVLWSDNARQSDWVLRELGYFDAQIDFSDPYQKPSDRRTIFLLLEGEPMAYVRFQMITDLRDEQVYAEPADHVDPNLWQRVVDKVFTALMDEDPPSQVRYQVEGLVDMGRYDEALRTVIAVTDDNQRTYLLDFLATNLAQAGRYDEAERVQSLLNQGRAEEAERQDSLDERPEPTQRELIDIATRALADEYSEDDQLGYEVYAEALADFIKDPKTAKPLTIGIDAPWGTGKTTLMHMIKRKLQPESRSHLINIS